MRNKILAPDVKEKMKIIDMKSEFIKIYGTRPNKRSIQSLIEDIQKQEQELKKMKETLEACQNYDSLWASYPKN
jgi:translation initiation factor 1 (eIF-1/SUI1)